MATLKDFANEYKPTQTKNIADLNSVPVSVEITDDSFTAPDETGGDKEVKIKVIEIEGEKYRIPLSVISQLKTHLEEKPSLQRFRVKKAGEGLKTNYTVIPLD